MANRRKNVDRVVKKAVGRLLLKNPDYTGRDLKKKVEKSLREKGLHYSFTERTYQNIKAEISPNLTDKPLDMPWNIGACVKYYDRIPPDTILLLIEYQKKIEELKRLSRLEPDDIIMRTTAEEKLAIPVILTFIVEEPEAKAVNLALDLILSTDKEELSRSQALVRLARFYLGYCNPVDEENTSHSLKN